jgi:hypothetical protein
MRLLYPDQCPEADRPTSESFQGYFRPLYTACSAIGARESVTYTTLSEFRRIKTFATQSGCVI